LRQSKMAKDEAAFEAALALFDVEAFILNRNE
jgi:hypothetical protein